MRRERQVHGRNVGGTTPVFIISSIICCRLSTARQRKAPREVTPPMQACSGRRDWKASRRYGAQLKVAAADCAVFGNGRPKGAARRNFSASRGRVSGPRGAHIRPQPISTERWPLSSFNSLEGRPHPGIACNCGIFCSSSRIRWPNRSKKQIPGRHLRPGCSRWPFLAVLSSRHARRFPSIIPAHRLRAAPWMHLGHEILFPDGV